MKKTLFLAAALIASTAFATTVKPTIADAAQATCNGQPWTFSAFLQGCQSAQVVNPGDSVNVIDTNPSLRGIPEDTVFDEPQETDGEHEPSDGCRGDCDTF